MLNTSHATTAMEVHGLARTFRSLRYPNYRLYFFGQLISLTGTWVQMAALTWYIYDRTHSNTLTAMISVAQVVPTFLFGFAGGMVADRFDRRNVLLCTQLAFLAIAATLALVIYLDVVEPWQLLILMSVAGLIQAIDLPTRLAFVNELVDHDSLPNAVALNAMLFNAARALGPAIAGGMLVAVGPAACFLVNAASYLAVVFALGVMTVQPRSEQQKKAATGSLLDGFRYLHRRKSLRSLMLLAAIVALIGWPCMTLLPQLARHRLGLEGQGYSNLLMSVGLGALVGALVVATLTSTEMRHRLLVAGVSGILLGILGLSLATQMPLITAACAILGFGLVTFFATGQATLQMEVADSQRGRVMGIWAMIVSGAIPTGNLIVGTLTDHFGDTSVLLGQAVIAAFVVVFVIFACQIPELNEEVETPD